MTPPEGYAIRRTVDIGFDEADRRVRAALESEGFGVPTEIDVRATAEKETGCRRPAL